MGIKHRLLSSYLPRFIESRAVANVGYPKGTALMYHEVLPDNENIPVWTVVRGSSFKDQMLHAREHYDVLSLDDAMKRLYSPRSSASGRHFVVITFDDGYVGNLHVVLPVMELLELPFTIFLSTSMIEQRGHYWYDKIIIYFLLHGKERMEFQTSVGLLRYLPGGVTDEQRWKRIRDFLDSLKILSHEERSKIVSEFPEPQPPSCLRMLAPEEVTILANHPLVTIGCHTHDHDLLDQLTSEEACKTIVRAQELIDQWCHVRPRHFCYPNGNYTSETIALVKELGFCSGSTTQGRPWTSKDSPFEIPRARIGRFDSLPLFRAKLSGILNE